MKKQDMNGVRVAQDLERKYKLQDIEAAEAQAKAAVSGLAAKLDISEYEDDIEALEQALEDLQEDLEEIVAEAIEEIEEATQQAIANIQDELEDYLLIASTLTTNDIDDIFT